MLHAMFSFLISHEIFHAVAVERATFYTYYNIISPEFSHSQPLASFFSSRAVKNFTSSTVSNHEILSTHIRKAQSRMDRLKVILQLFLMPPIMGSTT